MPTKVEGTKENVVPKDKEIRLEFVDDAKKLALIESTTTSTK